MSGYAYFCQISTSIRKRYALLANERGDRCFKSNSNEERGSLRPKTGARGYEITAAKRSFAACGKLSSMFRISFLCAPL